MCCACLDSRRGRCDGNTCRQRRRSGTRPSTFDVLLQSSDLRPQFGALTPGGGQFSLQTYQFGSFHGRRIDHRRHSARCRRRGRARHRCERGGSADNKPRRRCGRGGDAVLPFHGSPCQPRGPPAVRLGFVLDLLAGSPPSTSVIASSWHRVTPRPFHPCNCCYAGVFGAHQLPGAALRTGLARGYQFPHDSAGNWVGRSPRQAGGVCGAADHRSGPGCRPGR
jgi:hypothetical protein